MKADDPLRLEILKLLLQVVWADDEVQKEERDFVERFAGEMGTADLASSLKNAAALQAYLAGESPLPAPNLMLLREHRDQVIATAKALIRADAKIGAEEDEVLDTIREMLQG